MSAMSDEMRKEIAKEAADNYKTTIKVIHNIRTLTWALVGWCLIGVVIAVAGYEDTKFGHTYYNIIVQPLVVGVYLLLARIYVVKLTPDSSFKVMKDLNINFYSLETDTLIYKKKQVDKMLFMFTAFFILMCIAIPFLWYFEYGTFSS